MHVKSVTLEQLKKRYSHPSIYFFRAIELNAIREACPDIEFKNPALDLGCGDGFIASTLFDERFDFGLDNGEAKDVETAIHAKRYGNVLIESAEKISLPDENLEFTFSNCVLEHIPPIDPVFSEVGRVLKKGGKFLFTVPSPNYGDYLYLTNILKSVGMRFLSQSYANKRNQLLNHYHCYDHEEWRVRLKRYGMKMILYRYYLSKKALMLWDKMALQCFLGRSINGNFENFVGRRYARLIECLVSNDRVSDDQGACVLIYAEKM